MREIRDGTQGKILEGTLNPNSNGISAWADVDSLPDSIRSNVSGNGGGLIRSDGAFAGKYIVELQRGDKGKIVKIRTNGFSTKPKRKRAIGKLYGHICPVTGSGSRIETDHKVGRDDDYINNPDEGQALSKAANDAKREHCKKCVATNERFDAKSLGYKKGWTLGGKYFQGSVEGCKGCYWHDVRDFHSRTK